MKFEISDEDSAKVMDWLRDEVYPEVIQRQKKEYPNPDQFVKDCWDMGYPYEGAIGGGVTYQFIPTSIGMITKVKYDNYELNLTDYDSW